MLMLPRTCPAPQKTCDALLAKLTEALERR